MCKTCDSCHSYSKNDKPVFLGDGVCFLVPSKPKITKKTSSCKYWTKRKDDEK